MNYVCMFIEPEISVSQDFDLEEKMAKNKHRKVHEIEMTEFCVQMHEYYPYKNIRIFSVNYPPPPPPPPVVTRILTSAPRRSELVSDWLKFIRA